MSSLLIESDVTAAAIVALMDPGSTYAAVKVIIAFADWKLAIIGVAVIDPDAAAAYVYQVRRNGL
ncbi:MAG: hypothetical protein AAB263_00610 [Planctomycetota bacterium]